MTIKRKTDNYRPLTSHTCADGYNSTTILNLNEDFIHSKLSSVIIKCCILFGIWFDFNEKFWLLYIINTQRGPKIKDFIQSTGVVQPSASFVPLIRCSAVDRVRGVFLEQFAIYFVKNTGRYAQTESASCIVRLYCQKIAMSEIFCYFYIFSLLI